MSSPTLWSRALAALDALGWGQAEGVQCFRATALAGAHHPPLNPDVPALLLLDDAPDWAALGRMLGNQYPPDHTLSLVAPDAVAVQPTPLSALDQVRGEWLALAIPPLPRPGSFERFQETIAHLRAPEGCPWDRKQTHSSLRPYLLEETYEVLDALDNGDVYSLREELGDLLLQIVLHAQIAVEAR